MYLESGKNNEALQSLLQYKNRQVVLNWYEDEALVNRDGFFFSTIKMQNEELQFLKEEQIYFSIDLRKYDTLSSKKEFPNYYQLTKQQSILEIYFPH